MGLPSFQLLVSPLLAPSLTALVLNFEAVIRNMYNMGTEPASPFHLPPPGGDVDRATSLIAIYWIEVFLATLIISFRMVARHLKKNYGADDWLMIVTLVRSFETPKKALLKSHPKFMQIALASFVTKYALIGGTRYMYYLSPQQMTEILK